MKWSIQKKLIIVCLSLLIIPSLIVGIIGYNISKTELNTSAKTSLKNDVKLSLKVIEIANQKVKSGELSLSEAQEQVRETLIGQKNNEGKRKITKDIDIGENGYLYALDEKGNVVMHPLKEGANLINEKTKDGRYFIKEVIEQSKNGGDFVFYEWSLPNNPDEIAEKIVYGEKDPNWGWIVVAGSYLSDFNSGANKILTILIGTLASFIFVGTISIILFSRHLSHPLKMIAKQLHQIAKGDLCVKSLSVKNRDEVGLLAKDCDKMVLQLRTLISELHKSTELVTASSEELTSTSDQNVRFIENISTSFQEIASGTENQFNQMKDIHNQTSEIFRSIAEIKQTMNEMKESAEVASNAATKGDLLVKQGDSQMEQIGEHVDGMVLIVEDLNDKAREIGLMLNSIQDVAAQTNLLALNASIESARAGEHGKGFAVVAQEVRKLAEHSNSVAEDIGRIIDFIQKDTTKAIEIMKTGQDSVNKGKKIVHQNGEEFEHILTSTKSVSEQAINANSSLELIVNHVEKLAQNTESIHSIVEITKDNAIQVSATTQEQMASMEEISASAESLAKLAENLHNQVEHFKL